MRWLADLNIDELIAIAAIQESIGLCIRYHVFVEGGNNGGWSKIDDAARVAHDIVAHAIQSGLKNEHTQHAPLLNVNLPNLSYEQFKGWRVTKLGNRHPSQPVIEQNSPRGDRIYWIGAAGEAKDSSDGTDFHAVNQNYVSITPLQLNLSDEERRLKMMQSTWNQG